MMAGHQLFQNKLLPTVLGPPATGYRLRLLRVVAGATAAFITTLLLNQSLWDEG